MAKVSIIARQRKRERAVQKYQEKYLKFKKENNTLALDKLPKKALKVRLHNFCWRCTRPKGYIRAFGICRICFREMSSQGKIPGMRKASW